MWKSTKVQIKKNRKNVEAIKIISRFTKAKFKFKQKFLIFEKYYKFFFNMFCSMFGFFFLLSVSLISLIRFDHSQNQKTFLIK